MSDEDEKDTILNEFPFISPPPKNYVKDKTTSLNTPFGQEETKDYFEQEEVLNDWGEHFPTVETFDNLETNDFVDIEPDIISETKDDFLELLYNNEPNEDFQNVENETIDSEIVGEEPNFQTFSEESLTLPGTDNLPSEEIFVEEEKYFFETESASFYDFSNKNIDDKNFIEETLEEEEDEEEEDEEEERQEFTGRRRKKRRKKLPKRGVREEKIALALGIFSMLLGWAILPVLSSGMTIGLAMYSKKKALTGQVRPLTYANIAIGLGIVSLVFTVILFTVLSKNTV